MASDTDTDTDTDEFASLSAPPLHTPLSSFRYNLLSVDYSNQADKQMAH